MALARKKGAKLSDKKPAATKAALVSQPAAAQTPVTPAAVPATPTKVLSKSRAHRDNLVKKTGQKPRAAKQPSIAGGTYIAELDVNDQKYDADGTTALEALTNLAAQFPKMFIIKTRAVISLTKDNKTASMIFFAIQLRRLGGSGTVRDIWAKRLEMLMK